MRLYVQSEYMCGCGNGEGNTTYLILHYAFLGLVVMHFLHMLGESLTSFALKNTFSYKFLIITSSLCNVSDSF